MALAANESYERGLQDGRIAAIEAMQISQNIRLDGHGARISALEKGGYILLGVIFAMEFFPLIADMLRSVK